MIMEGWELENTDAISFYNHNSREKWINGFGIYEITSENKGNIDFDINIYEGNGN